MIHWSLANGVIIPGTSRGLMITGPRTATEPPVEVLPDLTKSTVIILTESPGLAPEEVESRASR
jgi:Cu/Ag efflux pump CusA